MEEIYFRGYFFRILRNRTDFFWAALLSTIVFTIFHGSKVNILNIAIPGFIYAFVYERTGSILISILTHATNNAIWVFLSYLGTMG